MILGMNNPSVSKRAQSGHLQREQAAQTQGGNEASARPDSGTRSELQASRTLSADMSELGPLGEDLDLFNREAAGHIEDLQRLHGDTLTRGPLAPAARGRSPDGEGGVPEHPSDAEHAVAVLSDRGRLRPAGEAPTIEELRQSVATQVNSADLAQVEAELKRYGVQAPPSFFVDAEQLEGLRHPHEDSARRMLKSRLLGHVTQQQAWQTLGEDGVRPKSVGAYSNGLYFGKEHKDGTAETWFMDRAEAFRTRVGPLAKKPAVIQRAFAKHGAGWGPVVWWRTLTRPARPFVLSFPQRFQTDRNNLPQKTGRGIGLWTRYTYVPLRKATRTALQHYVDGNRRDFMLAALEERGVARDLCVNLEKGPLFEADLVADALNAVAKKCWADPSADKDRIKNASLIVAQFLRGQDCEKLGKHWTTGAVPQDVLGDLDLVKVDSTLQKLKRACVKAPLDKAADNARYAAVIDGILLSGARIWVSSLNARNAQHVARASVITGVLFSVLSLGTNMIPFAPVKAIADTVSSVVRDKLIARSTAKYGSDGGLTEALDSAVEGEFVQPALSGRLVPGYPDWSYDDVEKSQSPSNPLHEECEVRAKAGRAFADQLKAVMSLVAGEKIAIA